MERRTARQRVPFFIARIYCAFIVDSAPDKLPLTNSHGAGRRRTEPDGNPQPSRSAAPKVAWPDVPRTERRSQSTHHLKQKPCEFEIAVRVGKHGDSGQDRLA
ncbi:hypothetical protein [Paraburkholderia solisilvae]|uniref:hypothetical protein n=1 Tax=Paraburkholderia solisilvae TaxID=624376 RepID=UPI0015834DDB|nr:hypothetical protein [Paraburkholderia solisilvae]